MYHVPKHVVACLILAIVLLHGCANEPSAVGREPVDGIWEVVNASTGGPIAVGDRLVFKDGTLNTHRPSGATVLPPAKFSIDQNANPPALDLHLNDGIAVGVMPCAYSCDGQSLTIVFVPTLLGPPGQPDATPPKEKLDAVRPKGFAADRHQATLKRVDDSSSPGGGESQSR